MTIRCIWEHNGPDSLLHLAGYPGAYTRGASLEEALAKVPAELAAWHRWLGLDAPAECAAEIVQEHAADLQVRDADSDVLFGSEAGPLTLEDYRRLKALALRSAQDFLRLYRAVPDPDASCLPARATFYGQRPRTAREMYEHTKNVNSYYFGEIGVDAGNDGDIAASRARGFALLEQRPGYLENPVVDGSYGEQWSLKKVCRRFVWHDRIHAKAMWRMACRTFGAGSVPDVFCFGGQ